MYVWGHPNITQTYRGVQSWGIQTYRGPSKHMGSPNVWGIWTPLSVTKHAFFVSKHMAVSTHIQGASKHRGAPYVWMPPVHTQHKESMLCQTKGVPICCHTFGGTHKFGYPHMFGWPPVCLDAPHMPPCMFGHPHMFGCPSKLGCPLCLDAPCMLGHPHIFRCPHMFG